MFDVAGLRVVVTGGSKGIGADVAKAFAEAGARVAIIARNLDRAQETAASLPGEARAYAADVADEAAVNDAFGAILEDFGGVDVLINNAGITRDRLLMQMKPDDWNSVLETNLRSCFLCCKAVCRPMLKQRSGRIINITSIIGLTGNAGQSNYAASKAGMIGYTKSLAKELASRSITVNAIAPGMIDTDMTRELPEEKQAEIRAGIPLGRLGSGEDVAAACLFLASPAAAYITGETLRVDGGLAC